MNTIATLDLLPAPRKSLTSAARSLGLKLQAALYGPVLTPKEPVLVTKDWSANPELVRQDVFMACCEAAAMYHHPWLNHVAEKLPGIAPVKLSACLICDWTGHAS